MPGNKPEFDLQPKAQERLPEAAVEALTSSEARIPFTLDEIESILAGAGAGRADHGPDDAPDLLEILSSIPGREEAHVAFGQADHGVEATPLDSHHAPNVPDWLDLG